MTTTGDGGDEELGKRVVAARGRSVIDLEAVAAPRASASKLSWGAVAIIAVAAVVVLFALRRSTGMPPTSGAVTADQRTEVSLGYRGVAVLEPGAAIDWTIAGDSAIAVGQHSGTVFYRARGSAPFAVQGVFGRLTVDPEGASFTLSAAELTVHQGRLIRVCGAVQAVFEAGPARDLPACSEAD